MSKMVYKSFVLNFNDSQRVFLDFWSSLLLFFLSFQSFFAFDFHNIKFLDCILFAFLSAFVLFRSFIVFRILVILHRFTHFSWSFFFLFFELLFTFVEILQTILGVILPNETENDLRVVRSDRWFDVTSSHFNLNEFLLVGSVWVVWEPVVEVGRTNAPLRSWSFMLNHGDLFNLWEKNLSGSRQGEVVLIDDDEVFADGHLLILVKDISHFVIIMALLIWYSISSLAAITVSYLCQKWSYHKKLLSELFHIRYHVREN